jgi:hypothetical protein
MKNYSNSFSMTEAGMSVDIGKGTVSGEILVLFFQPR